jgi:hypothetical protein
MTCPRRPSADDELEKAGLGWLMGGRGPPAPADKVGAGGSKCTRNRSKSRPGSMAATGGDSPSVAESYNNVGCIYKVPGKYKGALEMHTIVLEIRTQVSGYAMA